MGIKLRKKESMEHCDSCGATMTEYEYDRYGGLCKLCRGEESKSHVPAGKTSGIQGNEELSPKMQNRLKLKAWQDSSSKMKGFEEAGYSFLDLYEDGKCDAIAVPTKGYETEKEALAAAKEIFDDFDEYLEVTAIFDEEGGPDGEPVWFPAYGLKKTFVDLPDGEGLVVLSELSDTLYRLYTMGA